MDQPVPKPPATETGPVLETVAMPPVPAPQQIIHRETGRPDAPEAGPQTPQEARRDTPRAGEAARVHIPAQHMAAREKPPETPAPLATQLPQTPETPADSPPLPVRSDRPRPISEPPEVPLPNPEPTAETPVAPPPETAELPREVPTEVAPPEPQRPVPATPVTPQPAGPTENTAALPPQRNQPQPPPAQGSVRIEVGSVNITFRAPDPAPARPALKIARRAPLAHAIPLPGFGKD